LALTRKRVRYVVHCSDFMARDPSACVLRDG
jgi:hypothetical protein